MSSMALSLPIGTGRRTPETSVVETTFDRCAQAFYRFFHVRTRGNTHLIDDLMQQLWLQCRLKAKGLESDNAEPWMWRIARNLLNQHWRKSGSMIESNCGADPALAVHFAERMVREELPLDYLSRQEVKNQLMLALTALPHEEQALLLGHYFEKRTHEDLAQSLSVSIRAVEGRLYRARQALRDKLSHLDSQE